ncbi:bifunctional sesquiterpene synthase 1-like [Salvia miltiorrhiza]|uniref:bifunctional sesquiterpene synthase 1-like n=1 Tax=Salvia miltiorrhiza TaxID=226208 RepID=UPI0025AC713E|nr:bifunctional sesquiterpene synthase 1-like [Salvia miltiorrhiza]
MELDNHTASNKSCRPLANFHPNIWGDQFLHYTPHPNMAGDEQVVEELKEELKRELKELSSHYIPLLKLVDAIQRLGIEYHFEQEIDEALQNLSQNFHDYCKQNPDIYPTALGFRLLRQHGYRVSCEIFDKFMDKEEGGLKVVTSTSSKEEAALGILELLEASYLRIRDERVLDEAVVCARSYLASALPNLSKPAAQQVDYALHEHSNRRGLRRLQSRLYISIYEQYPCHHQRLLTLAKLDFNLLQSMHKKELSELYRWWKGFGLSTNLKFARDRLVETYYWVLALWFEPKYAVSRNISTKVQALISIVDDAFDAYATFEELQIFTEAIERWSISSLDQLPEYMKIIYKGLLEVGEEIEEEMKKQGKPYRIGYAIEAIKVMVRDYLVEIKWREEKYKPTSEEYMRVGTASCAYTSLIIISFIGMDDATKEAFDWVLSQPHIVKSTLLISRLSNDIAGHEFEKEREHIPSIVECYMEEHEVSKAEAVSEFKIQAEEAWKDINEAFLRPTAIPAPLLYPILNFARVIEAIYHKEADWYTHVGPEMQTFIRQLFIDQLF